MAIKIDIQEALDRAERRKNEPAPLPVIIVRKADGATRKPQGTKPQKKHDDEDVTEKASLLQLLEHDYAVLMKERKVLSSKTAALVDQIADDIRKKSGAGAADAFLNGLVPVPALREHYAKIQSKSDLLATMYDKIEYVKQHGVLPSEAVPAAPNIENSESVDIKATQYEIRRLDDLIHKTQKKIERANGGIKQPKNSARMLAWKEKISIAELKREQLKKQLNNMRYESREQRTAAE